MNVQLWEDDARLSGDLPALCIKGDHLNGNILLQVIDELAAAGPPAQRSLTTLPRISLLPETEELKQMSLTREAAIANLQFTVNGLNDFRNAVNGWLNGAEDFSLHPSGSRKARHLKRSKGLGSKDLASGELWFWTAFTDP